MKEGIVLINKSAGMTSHDVVAMARRRLGIKKIGHAGTLDPFASGLLIICAGRPATKLISGLMEGEKEYLATLRLGVETSTQDPEGIITARKSVGILSEEAIEKCLQNFAGHQKQVPPAYSALKHKGKPLYYYARKGIEVIKEARQIHIKIIERIDGGGDITGAEANLRIRVICSKGTYIRTLAADIGKELGCGAYLTELRRTRSGVFSVDKSFPGQDFTQDVSRERFLAGALSVNEVCNLLH